MSKFEDINLSRQLCDAINDLGFQEQTPIQRDTLYKEIKKY